MSSAWTVTQDPLPYASALLPQYIHPRRILRQPSEKSLIRFPSSQKAVTFGHVEDNTGKISGGSWEAEKTYSPSVPEKGGARERAKVRGVVHGVLCVIGGVRAKLGLCTMFQT